MKITEENRIENRNNGKENWSLWGPYLSERQWGTVREDYSKGGDAWDYLTHDHARSRAYRWGEDGLMGICDEKQRLCFALALWNGQDAILKERLFGLTNHEGNHGEDVKELYYHLDNLPSHAYMRGLYKYPQAAFPYQQLLDESKNRSRDDAEFELLDTGIFDNSRYFDVEIEYAKDGVADIYIQLNITNRGADTAPLWVLPTLWFRNRWSFGLEKKPTLRWVSSGVEVNHETLGNYLFTYENAPKHVFFTENETNTERLFNIPNKSPYVKDAFHEGILKQNTGFLTKNTEGSKCAPVYELNIKGGETVVLKFRLSDKIEPTDFEKSFDTVLKNRQKEADDFYKSKIIDNKNSDDFDIRKQALAGLLWSKQFYEFDVETWLKGDKGQPSPPHERYHGRNATWQHFKAADVILMPDTWEYPWFAAWDLAFHAVGVAKIDPVLAQQQLLLLFDKRYQSPDGGLPAYEWSFDDTNPPVQAWAAWKIYRADASKPTAFLIEIFEKLLPYYHYWETKKDVNQDNLFEGGFLGLDNISVFDRSAGIPFGGHLEQADGTAWMACFCLYMLRISTEIALFDIKYEDECIHFFTEFEHISQALCGLDDDKGFFYDVLSFPDGQRIPLKIHSLVGALPLLAAMPLEEETLAKLPKFQAQVRAVLRHKNSPNEHMILADMKSKKGWLLALSSKEKLVELLTILGDENEMLSPYGIRSVSKKHEFGYAVEVNDQWFGMKYVPGESDSELFGGNSNWRGPIWLPINLLVIDAFRRYHFYYGDDLKVEFPTHSGSMKTLKEIADDISIRLWTIFRKDKNNHRPFNDGAHQYAQKVDFQGLILFYEYFHAETGKGLGASHQSGWTGLMGILDDLI
jgi:Glycosyl hydrolase family 63 C-terminal domain